MSLLCLRLHSPLKTVFGKVGDTYQAYCNPYKTHAMATNHRGLGSPLDRDINMTRETKKTADTNTEDTHDFNTAETDHFEDLGYNNPAKLTALTREVDELCQLVQDGEGQPMETLNCIEHELQKLYIALNHQHPLNPLEK